MGQAERSRPTGFDYIIDKSKQSRICFGSGLERCPKPRAVSAPISVVPKTDRSSDILLQNKTSLKGRTITFGKSPRWTVEKNYEPPLYSLITSKITKTSYAPFNHSTPRIIKKINLNPGPGTYNPNDSKRNMKFNHSFGGRKTIVPAVEIKCVPFNNDTCANCEIECSKQGDYWHKDFTVFYCRACMESLYLDDVARKKYELKKFRPIRDCFFAHHHELFENSIKLMSAREIRKKITREAYLCQYFPHIEEKKCI